jgi:hypothetical protein
MTKFQDSSFSKALSTAYYSIAIVTLNFIIIFFIINIILYIAYFVIETINKPNNIEISLANP